MKKICAAAFVMAFAASWSLVPGQASSHREAPLISTDPLADNTDLYAFRSPDRPDTVTIIANYIPLEAPAGGPNFLAFDDAVLYEIHVDNDGTLRKTLPINFASELKREPEHFPV